MGSKRMGRVARQGWRLGGLVAGLLAVSGCDTLHYHLQQAQAGKAGPATQAARVEPSAAAPRKLTATGYAPISLQPGANPSQKMLMAMRASKLRAYQELAAMVHGQYLYGSTQVRDLVVENDQFNAAVGGIIRGARVVKTYPVQDDTYATILELDMADVQRAYVMER